MKVKGLIFSIVLVLFLFFSLLSCSTPKIENNLQEETTVEKIAETTSLTTTAAETAETTVVETTTEIEIINYCNNSYFPIKENIVWNYTEEASQSESVKYSVSFKKVEENLFTKIITTPYSTIETKWSCTEKGLIQTELSQWNFTDSVLFIYEFDTTRVEGITFPSENEMKVGKSWDTNYEAKTKMASGEKVIDAIAKVEIKNEIVSIESVKVLSENYPEALKITSKMTTNLNMDNLLTQPVISNSNSWFVKDIGFVKQVCKSDNANAKIELLSKE